MTIEWNGILNLLISSYAFHLHNLALISRQNQCSHLFQHFTFNDCDVDKVMCALSRSATYSLFIFLFVSFAALQYIHGNSTEVPSRVVGCIHSSGCFHVVELTCKQSVKTHTGSNNDNIIIKTRKKEKESRTHILTTTTKAKAWNNFCSAIKSSRS